MASSYSESDDSYDLHLSKADALSKVELFTATPCLTGHAEISSDRIPVTVAVKDISFYLPYNTIAQQLIPCAFGSRHRITNVTQTPLDESRGIEILHNINLLALPNQLTAIMGPSGCGKTTLMNIIGQRAQGTVSGTITYNNVVATRRNLKGCMSMCYASERLLPYLSVEETLFFATILKMGQASARERKERVNEVIADMALEHVRHTRIGGVWGKGLSSGEVRRTAIAVELIGDPAVLLLDEPTSGLDAVLAFEIMFVLKSLALQGRTVICSVHQPRAAIFELFDSLLLMAQGRVLFHGPAKMARSWFSEETAIDVPSRVNIADALIDIASEAGNTGKKAGCSAVEISEAYEKSDSLRALQGQITEVRCVDSPQIRLADRNRFLQWFVEVAAVAFRSFRNSMRNPLSFSLVLVIQAFMGCFLGAIFYKLPNQYLPEQIPIYVGDPDNPLMNLFNNSAVAFVNSGIDQTGYNPWLEMLVAGVDGNNSQPFLEFLDREIARHLYNSLHCVHEQLELEDCYPQSSFAEYDEVWGAPEGDELWAGGSDFTPPVLTSYLIKDFQVLDYALTKFFYDDILSTFTAANGMWLLLTLPCHSQVRELAYTFSGCSGVPILPTFDKTQNSLAFGFCNNIGNAGGGSVTENENRGPIPKCGFFQPTLADSVSQEVSASNVGYKANADVGAARKLQAAALVGSDGASFYAALPPVLRGIVDRMPVYQDAFTNCNHEFCHIVKSALTSSEEGNSDQEPGSSSTAVFKALSDYGSVLGAVMNIMGALMFSIANIGFASYDALVSIPQERCMINREMINYLYKPSSYFIGKTLADMTFQLAPSLMLVTTFYFLVGVDIGQHGYYFWRYLGICALVIFAAYGFAYFISAASPTMEVAVVTAPVILVIFLCCSGFFVRDAGMPDWMQWLKYLSFYRWGFFGLVVNQFPPDKSYAGLPNGFSLAVGGINELRLSVCCGALVALGVGFRILAYLALKFLNRRIGIEQ